MSGMDYDFQAKHAGYRVPAWCFADRMVTKPRRLRRVAILDTKQGLEVRHLVRIGYAPENILVINYSAAELAVMTKGLRADGIEGVQTKAGEFGDVLMRWRGKLHVIGFDTTSNLASKSFVLLSEVVERHLPECLIVVMLAGREGKYTCSRLADLAGSTTPRRDSLNHDVNRNHFARIATVLASLVMQRGPRPRCVFHVPEFRWATYASSSGQPMVWACARIAPHERDRRPLRGFCGCDAACAGAGNLLASMQKAERFQREKRQLEAERKQIMDRRLAREAQLEGHAPMVRSAEECPPR